MSRSNKAGIVYTPLYIHSFQFLRPHKLTDAEKFNIQYSNPILIPTTADKLRYYRYKKSLLQRDVADYAGIDRSTYMSYETGERDYYPLDKLSKIAELLDVDITKLLDDYNRFLFDGQGEQIRRFRKLNGLTQADLARMLNVHTGTVKKWESNISQISLKTYSLLQGRHTINSLSQQPIT